MEGDWLIAARQSAGRGRQGRQWATLDGNFFGSTLVSRRDGDPPASSLALVAGLALIEAADTAVPGAPLSLKWPNDLLLGGAKAAGILLERAGDRIVAGFGVNLSAAPRIEGRATAAFSSPARITPHAFAPLLAASFARVIGAWRVADPVAFAQAWEERAHRLDTPLTVHVGADELLAGRFAGIDPDGALRLKLDDGRIERVRAGDVALG